LKRLDEVTFFIDRCLGKHVIAERLKRAGLSVEVHDDHFPSDCADEVWLAGAGANAWIVITKDKNFQRRQLEILALARAGVRVFQLSSGGMTGDEMAKLLAKASKKITNFAQSNRAPFIARISRSGKIQMAIAHTRLRKISQT
jgi:predicted nuclease of predicted toxin-antitoxin system